MLRLVLQRSIIMLLVILGLFFAFPVLALAQDNGGELIIGWAEIIAGLISGALVPLAVQLLIFFYPKAPTWLKAIAGPVIVPMLALAAAMISSALGYPVDFGPIIAVITGAGAASSLAFTMGRKKGVRKRR